jgi:signal transduction histidine kinase
VRKDGSHVWIALTVSLVRHGEAEEPYFISVVEEIMERRKTEEALRRAVDSAFAERSRAERAAERTRRLQAITAQLSAALTPAQVADTVVTEGIAAVDAAAGFVSLLSPNGDSLELVASRGYAPGDPQRWARLPLSTPLAVGAAARAGEPIWLESPQERANRFPESDRLFGGGNYEAWAMLPLVVESRSIGTLGMSFSRARRFGDADRSLMLALAQQCAQALERARLYREAQSASDAKSGFMAVVSHELRTPLNAIIGYAELLLMGIPETITARAADQVSRLRAAAHHLLGLIEEILTFSRLEAGRENISLARVSLAGISTEVSTVIEPLARARGLTFDVECRAAELTMETDAGKLRQILINLLGNAVKFTDHGSVKFDISALEDSVEFTVSDTGIGIDPQHIGHVFEPFWQVEAMPSRRAPGTGLGLSVTQRLVIALGGSITVESAPGKGSTFRVRLPLGHAEGIQTRSVPPSVASPSR